MMRKLFSPEFLYDKWSSGKSITLNKKKYHVNKMSYGDFYFEPVMNKKEKKKYYGETKPMHPEILWLESVLKKNRYGVDQKFFEVI
jgi:hypothetical protein